MLKAQGEAEERGLKRKKPQFISFLRRERPSTSLLCLSFHLSVSFTIHAEHFTSGQQCMEVFLHSRQFSATPAECSAVQLYSDTVILETASDSTG